MGKRVGLISLVGVVFVLCLVTMVLAEDFSADMISTNQGMVFKGKIFSGQDKIRMEVPGSITIVRMDRQVMWLLMPKEKMYMEQPVDPTKAAATSDKVSGEIERKLVGKESIDGRMTDKYQIVYNQNGKKQTLFQWFTAGLSVPIKTAAADNSWVTEYKNIKTDRQPDALFEVPADYQKLSNPMGPMKDMLEKFGK